MTDTRGNTYIQAGTTITGTGMRQAIYYAKNIAAGSNTVTVAFNQAAPFADVRILEYSGLDQTSPLDVTAGAAGTGTAANSGAATTTSANELIVGAGMTASAYTATGTGFTLRTITNPNGDIAEDRTATATGSYSATAAILSSKPWIMQMATFRASGQGTGNPAPTVSAISPTLGTTAGGTPVTITGTGFRAGATASLGGTAATGVTVVNSTSITATTAAHAAGTVNVVVTNTDAQSGSLANGYTYTSTTASLGLVVPSGDPSSATVAAGQTASYILSIGGYGMSGTASLSCSGAPGGATCSVPASQPFSATVPATFHVNVTTTARTTGALRVPSFGLGTWMWSFGLLGMVILPGRSARRRVRQYLRLMPLTLILLLASCGGGGGNSGGGQSNPNPNGTAAGTYTLNVTATATGATPQTTSLTLIVQ